MLALVYIYKCVCENIEYMWGSRFLVNKKEAERRNPKTELWVCFLFEKKIFWCQVPTMHMHTVTHRSDKNEKGNLLLLHATTTIHNQLHIENTIHQFLWLVFHVNLKI